MTTSSDYNITRLVFQVLILLIILAALLFLPAGKFNWPQAWAFILTIGIYFLIYVFWGIRKDPEQTQERSQMAENIKRWDKVIMGIYTVLLPAVFITAGFDVGRFGWSKAPLSAQLVGWIGLILASALILWTVRTNTYLSRYARIQDDRGQEVVISGPYRYIRHPMYLGILILFTCIGPALSSLFALIPSVIIDILFIIRTAKEDKMLRKELEGYQAYTQKVRYRLLSGIW
ncbi:MAG: isoprenylcysteine carboxylmethyltransferase family protein [Chloroflexota bacterium]|nr:isoprenylcysteine carboxylmethyltransferase family protein [Chloroflexota bacterium]